MSIASQHRHPKLSSPPWTASEDSLLRQYYASEGSKACVARLPGRTKHAVKKRAETLGIRVLQTLDTDALARLQRICEGSGAEDLEQLSESLGVPVTRLRQLATQHGWIWPGRILSRPWTAAADRDLTEFYRTFSLEECARRLKRDRDHVKARIKKLGLSKRAPIWTADDDRKLTVLYSTKSCIECAALLNRTKGAVQTRAHVLGLTVKPEPRHPSKRRDRRESAFQQWKPSTDE